MNRGGISEQVKEGVTGFLCDSVKDLGEAMQDVDAIDPKDCRAYAEAHFTSRRMAADYMKLYEAVINGQTW